MRTVIDALVTCGLCWAAALAWAPPAAAQPTAAGAPTVTVSQQAYTAEIVPLSGTQPASALYDYRDYQAHLDAIEPGRSVMFFYRDTTTDDLALVVVHGPPAIDITNTTGIARFIFNGLPAGARLALRDDPQDEFEFTPPAARLRWKWYSGRTDGVVIDQLGDDFALQLTPHFIQGVSDWSLWTQGPDGPQAVPLPSLSERIEMKTGAAAGRGVRAAFEISPPEAVRAFVPVTFDARGSLAPDGSDIMLYEWDFDGDGTFDAQTERALVTHVFQRGGPVHITLRITTSGGDTAVAVKTIHVLVDQLVQVRRELSTSVALPGRALRVTLTIRVAETLVGLGIEELWPPDWVLQDVQNDGAVVKTRRGQWVFAETLSGGEEKTIVYDVIVPEDQVTAVPAVVAVSGTLTASLPHYRTDIEGESQLQVATCLPTAVALAHLDLDAGGVDLRLPETITSGQQHHARALWLDGGRLPDACAERVTLADYQRVLAHAVLGLAVDEPLPDGKLGAGVRAERAILTPLEDAELYLKVPGGNRFRVRLTLTVLRPLTSLGVGELLPYGWEVYPVELPGVLYHPSEHQWLLPGPWETGQRLLLIYDVVTPPGGDPGLYLIRGSAQPADSAFTEQTGGDQEVTVLECLGVLKAIAHWDPVADAIDLSLDNAIHADQALAATDLWLFERDVPGTCGARLDYAALQVINEYALTGIPVTQALPED